MRISPGLTGFAATVFLLLGSSGHAAGAMATATAPELMSTSTPVA